MVYLNDVGVMFLLNLWKWVWIICQPILISLTLDYIDTDSQSDGGIGYGMFLVIIYALLDFISNIISEQINMILSLLQIKVKNGIVCLIYEKILKLSSATNKDFTQGEIINFINVDINKINYLLLNFPLVMRFPILVIFGFGFLMYYFGYSIFAAAVVGVTNFLILFIIEKILAKIEDKILFEKDKRMRWITEIVNSIKVIKLNSLSDQFTSKISSIRNEELFYFKIKLILESLKTGVSWLSSPMMIVSTLLVFYQTGHSITVAKAFAGIQVLYFLERPLKWFPDFIGKFLEFDISMKRISKFLICNEYNSELVEYIDVNAHRNLDIIINDANFTWGGQKQVLTEIDSISQEEISQINNFSSQLNFKINEHKQNKEQELFHNCIVLKNISLNIAKGDLVYVIGRFGGGKSSLINAILGELIYIDDSTMSEFSNREVDEETRNILWSRNQQYRGIIKLGGSVSLIQQIPWIQNKTIRDNITFEHPFDKNRYE